MSKDNKMLIHNAVSNNICRNPLIKVKTRPVEFEMVEKPSKDE